MRYKISSDTCRKPGGFFLVQQAVDLAGRQWLRMTLERGHTSRTLVYFKLVIDVIHASYKTGGPKHFRQFVGEYLASQRYHAVFCRDVKGSDMHRNSSQTRAHAID